MSYDVKEINQLVGTLSIFEKKITCLIERINPALFSLFADHIAVRCQHIETANQWRQGFLQCGQLVSENQINGRPICLFTLFTPITLRGWEIGCVELPYPSHKHYPHEGWEHIELVLACQADEFYQQAFDLLPSAQRLAQQGITLKKSQPKGENETTPNPTLALSDGDVVVKLHACSILDIIHQ